MIAGLLLHKTPMAYMRAISRQHAVPPVFWCNSPSTRGSNDDGALRSGRTHYRILHQCCDKDTFPVMTFFSSALINFAVRLAAGTGLFRGRS